MGKPPERWDVETDIVTVGSGSGALTGAIVAREHGAQATVLEWADKVGGGSAYSGGMVWIPNNHHMAELGIPDSREEALIYMRGISGGAHDEKLLQTYVDTAPRVLKYVEETAGAQMEMIRPSPDYYAELPGGKMEGRYLVSKLFDSKTLGDWQPRLRLSPHFPMAATFSEIAGWGGFANIANWDWELLGRRAQEGIVGWGAALIGVLLKACLARRVSFLMQTRARELLQDASGRVVGVRAEQEGRSVFVKGRRGVLLASGGFEWNQELRERLGSGHVRANTPPFNRGDSQLMALELGAAWAQLDDSGMACLSVPGEEHDGQPLYRIFGRDAARPGMIIVNKQGTRFANDAFYMAVKGGMQFFDGATQRYPNAPCFAICDHGYKQRYPLGTVLPWDGAPAWMNASPTLRELAVKLGINPDNLENTVASFNSHAREGRDPAFRRGETAYDRKWGDEAQKPNPSLGPLDSPPFYGFQLVHAGAATGSGVLINSDSQVVHLRGEPIPGLYACPNVAARRAVGRGYTSGQSLAQSMTFAYLGVLHATRKG